MTRQMMNGRNKQKSVASKSMESNRRFCKHRISLNWCGCGSLDECFANSWECRADGMPWTSSECICQVQGIRFILEGEGLTPIGETFVKGAASTPIY